MATPNPASPNHTEQLLAEAEVQQFAAALENSLAMIVKSSVGGEGPRAETLSKAGPIWIRSLITRPAALYLTRLAPQAPGPGGPGRGDLSITAEGGLIVQAGDSAALLDAALTEILATEEQKPVEFTIGTRKFHRLAASEDF